MAKIRIAFVGVGSMGQCAHLQNYITFDDCEVVALAEMREDLGKKVAARYGVPRVYKTHTELLAKEKVDGIVTSQGFDRHGVILPELFQTGACIFTEKPLTNSVETGRKIVDALNKSKSRYFVGYHKRSDPATMLAKKEMARLLETKELGALKYVRICMPAGDWVANGFSSLITSSLPIPDLERDPPPSDMDTAMQEKYIGFVNYYIHQINLMRHLLGEDYRIPYGDPKGVTLSVVSASGIPGTIEMSPYCTTIDWQESALIAFEKGYILLELLAPLAHNQPGKVTIFRDPGKGKTPEKIIPQLPLVHAMRQQARNFLDAIQGKPTPLCSPQDALKDLEVSKEYILLKK